MPARCTPSAVCGRHARSPGAACHALPCYLQVKPPHGPAFKFWAGCALRAHPELPVTTCHAYQIHAPFRWRCAASECGREYQRHSNSIDVERQACGACRGRLAFLGRACARRNYQTLQKAQVADFYRCSQRC